MIIRSCRSHLPGTPRGNTPMREAAFLNPGAIILREPHQPAHKNTTRGMLLRATVFSELAAASSTGVPENCG